MKGPGVSSTAWGASPSAGAASRKRGLQLAEEGGERLRPKRSKRIRKQSRDRRAVLERVADAGWRLRPGADDAPRAVRAAREIECQQVQKDTADRRHAVARGQKPGMPEDERRRQEPLVDQRLRTVDVRRDRVQQPRALAEAAGKDRPFAGGHQQRQHIERPGARRAVGRGVHVVGNAVLVDLAGDASLGVGEPVAPELARVRREILPGRPQRALGADDLIEVALGNRVAGHERPEPAPAGQRLLHAVRRSSV